MPNARLPGVRNDLDTMHATLKRWGFTCEERFDERATRDEILRALDDLIESTNSGHAVVLYYCGHGGRARLHRDGLAWNYLVTADHRRDAFRGVAEIELTARMRRLCAKTRNVTAIFDCCHAATICRDDPPQPERARVFDPIDIPRPGDSDVRIVEPYTLPPDLRAQLVGAPRDSLAAVHENPDLVVLTATTADSSAYEFQDADARDGQTRYRGYFTTKLCAALDRARATPMAWDSVIERARQEIAWARRSTTQRPEVVGPRARLPFSLQTVAEVRDQFLVVPHQSDGLWLASGRLCGLELGDRLAVQSLEGDDIGVATIEELYDDSARLEFAETTTRPSTAPYLAVALTSPADDRERACMLDKVLRGGGPGLGKVEATVEAWVEERGGEPRRLGARDRIRAGSLLWAEVRHTTPNKPPIYINAIGIGVDGKAGLINQAQPAGLEIRAQQSEWIGRLPGGRNTLCLKWPASVPADAPRPAALLLVASRRPLDLRRLCEDPHAADSSSAHRSSTRPHDLGTPLMWTVTRFELELLP